METKEKILQKQLTAVLTTDKTAKVSDLGFLLMTNVEALLNDEKNPQLKEMYNNIEEEAEKRKIDHAVTFKTGVRMLFESILTTTYLSMVATEEEKQAFEEAAKSIIEQESSEKQIDA